MVPSFFSLMTRSRHSTRCGVLRRCVPTCTTRLCLRAAEDIAFAIPAAADQPDARLAVGELGGMAGGSGQGQPGGAGLQELPAVHACYLQGEEGGLVCRIM